MSTLIGCRSRLAFRKDLNPSISTRSIFTRGGRSGMAGPFVLHQFVEGLFAVEQVIPIAPAVDVFDSHAPTPAKPMNELSDCKPLLHNILMDCIAPAHPPPAAMCRAGPGISKLQLTLTLHSRLRAF